jgi:hypothetical protein
MDIRMTTREKSLRNQAGLKLMIKPHSSIEFFRICYKDLSQMRHAGLQGITVKQIY